FLERRRHEPLAIRDCLSSLKVGRHEMKVRLRHLDVVPEDPVEADLERSDAGAFALGSLDVGDGILATVAQRAQPIELRVYIVRDCRLVANGKRWMLDDGRLDRSSLVGAAVPVLEQTSEQCQAAILRELPHESLDIWKAGERRAQCADVARTCSARGDLCAQPLDVADAVECSAERLTSHRVVDEARHDVESLVDRCTNSQWSKNPLSEQ